VSLPRVVVVLPVHNRRDTTLRALRSLARLDRTTADIDVIVVDDGSTDGTAAAIAAQSPDVTVVPGDGSLFYAAGTNLGVAHALERQPDFIVMANDDAVFSSGCVRELVRCAAHHPRAVVGALLLRWDALPLTFQVGQRWDTWFGGWRVPQRLSAFGCPREPWTSETLPGNCILVPAAAFREVGLMDAARFPHHGADVELCARLRRRGWTLLTAPAARVFCETNTYPAPLHTLSASTLAFTLFRNRVHPLHLPTLWRSRIVSGPTRVAGLAAAVVYTLRMGCRAAGLGSWPAWPDLPLPGNAEGAQ
jgi:GT2 family glycosyltransferase